MSRLKLLQELKDNKFHIILHAKSSGVYMGVITSLLEERNDALILLTDIQEDKLFDTWLQLSQIEAIMYNQDGTKSDPLEAMEIGDDDFIF